MRILVFGAGAVGSLLGGFLTRSGHDVWLLGRARHLDIIEKNGLTVTGIWGEFRTKALETAQSVDEIISKKLSFDLVLLTVKSYDTEEAIRQIKRFISPESTLLSFQNGLGNIEIIRSHIDESQYLAGRIITGVELEPGLVRVTVSADDLAIGALSATRTHMSAAQAAQLFNLSNIKAKAVSNIESIIWAKAIYNCALNAICTLKEIPYGDILKTEETRDWMREIVFECYEAARHENLKLDPDTPEAYLKLLTERLIPLTASHYPSMLQDLRKGRRLEIDALNGAIVRFGQKHGFQTLANQKIVSRLKQKSHPESKS